MFERSLRNLMFLAVVATAVGCKSKARDEAREDEAREAAINAALARGTGSATDVVTKAPRSGPADGSAGSGAVPPPVSATQAAVSANLFATSVGWDVEAGAGDCAATGAALRRQLPKAIKMKADTKPHENDPAFKAATAEVGAKWAVTLTTIKACASDPGVQEFHAVVAPPGK